MESIPLTQPGAGADRLARLRRQLEPLVALPERFAKRISISNEIDAALPLHGLPLGCVHELQSNGLAGGIAFAALLSTRLPDSAGPLVYVSSGRSLHATGLLSFGVRTERWIHVSARRSQDLSWATLEALRCTRVGMVLSELKAADLTLCRRFQLAAEESGATGFLLNEGRERSAIASVITRWRIAPRVAPSDAAFCEPCWDLNLTYCRGAQPGRWSVAWRNAQLELLEPASKMVAAEPPQRTRLAPARRLAG